MPGALSPVLFMQGKKSVSIEIFTKSRFFINMVITKSKVT